MATDAKDRLLTVAYLARVVGRPRSFVLRLIREGQFPALLITPEGHKRMSERAFNARLDELGVSRIMWNTEDPLQWDDRAAVQERVAAADREDAKRGILHVEGDLQNDEQGQH